MKLSLKDILYRFNFAQDVQYKNSHDPRYESPLQNDQRGCGKIVFPMINMQRMNELRFIFFAKFLFC